MKLPEYKNIKNKENKSVKSKPSPRMVFFKKRKNDGNKFKFTFKTLLVFPLHVQEVTSSPKGYGYTSCNFLVHPHLRTSTYTKGYGYTS